jgi:hypothetical protein
VRGPRRAKEGKWLKEAAPLLHERGNGEPLRVVLLAESGWTQSKVEVEEELMLRPFELLPC